MIVQNVPRSVQGYTCKFIGILIHQITKNKQGYESNRIKANGPGDKEHS